MSQETRINDLPNNINDEDSKLVNSILNDINNGSTGDQQPSQINHTQQGQGQGQGSQLNADQLKMLQQQQMAMRQQQLAQQQLAQQQQQMAAQQQMNNQKKNIIQNESGNNIINGIKEESKNIMTIIFLCILFNLDPINNIFKSQSFFINESGELNIQTILIKAIIIGISYYIIKTYLI